MNNKNLMEFIESKRHSRVITYVTGDRQPFNTIIAEDTIPIFKSHLDKIGVTDKISLFIYTRGGALIVPLKIVKLIKSYCNKFEILIPYRCHSAGTLIALGADNIVMGKLGELSPVDPSTTHPFNPQNPAVSQEKLPISVEDLNSYLLFAEEMAKVDNDKMIEVFKYLVENIHPLSLGNAYRVYRIGKMISEKLLKLHMNEKTEKEKIKSILKEITGETLCIHEYPIYRDEAKNIGLDVEIPDKDLEEKLWELYEAYEVEMKLNIPFYLAEVLGDKEMANAKYIGACIESRNLLNQFIYNVNATKTSIDGKSSFNLNILSSKWEVV